MSETYSVKAVLSAVDNGLISTIDKAISSLNGITKKSGVFGNTAGNSFRRASESASDFTSSVARLATAIGITQAVTAGINAMKNSMGSAVSRMDTLNNASRVFKNMGFAAGDTSKMMDQLQASIKGLPTPLDEAVKGVQMIASSTGDIGKSQEIWSALNDSILGFGGSTADVNNAVLQLSQAFSNGKIDGMTWISMMNSQMGPVLSAIAKQMGLTTGQLKDGLASGKISVQQFQDALIELDKNGGGGLASLHQIALTATGGISTSMQNAKTSVVRGLTEMLKGFDTFAQSVTGLSLSQIIAQIGTAVEGVLDKVAANIPKAAGYFKNLGLTANQSKGLITGFVTAAMGIGALVALSPVIGSVVTAFGGLFSIVGKVTSAFAGLVSFFVSPWGAAVLAIGLVVGALVNLYTQFQPFHDAVNNVVGSFVQGFGQAIPQALGLLNNLFTNITGSIQIVADAVQNQLGGSFTKITPQMVSQGIINGLNTIVQFISNVINAVAEMTAAFINTGAVQEIWKALGAVIDAIKNVITNVVTAINNFTNDSNNAGSTTNIWQNIGDAIGTIAKWISNAILAIANFVSQSSGGFGQVVTFIMQVISAIGQMVQAFVNTGAVQAVWDAIKAIFGAIKSVIGNVIKGIGELIGASDGASSTQDVWSNIGTAIGNIVKIIANIIKGIANFIKHISSMPGVITPVIGSVVAFFAAFKGINMVIGLMNTLKKAFIVGKVIKDTAGDINLLKFALSNMSKESQLAATAQKILNGVMSINPFALIVGAITAVVAALVFFFTKTQTGQEIWQKFTDFLSGVWNGLVSTAKTVFNGLADFFSTLWKTITDTASNVWNAITGTLSNIWNGIVSIAQPIFNNLAQFLSNLWDGIKSIAKGAWELIKTVILSPVLILIDLVTGNFNKLKSDLGLIWNSIKDAGSSIWNGLKNIFTTVTTAIKNAIVNIWQGAKNLIVNIWNGLKSAGSNIVNAIKSFFTSGFNNTKNAIISIAKGMANGAKAAWNGIVRAAQWVVDTAKNIFHTLRNINLLDIGKSIINGFLKGLKSAFNGVKDFIGGIGKWIRKHKGPIQYDRKLLIPAGNAIMQGLNAGLMHSFKDVQGNVSTMAQSIAEAANNNISSNLSNINANLAGGNINHMISGQLEVKQQPAYINLNMGGHDYGAFVEDITKEQDVKISLGKFGV